MKTLKVGKGEPIENFFNYVGEFGLKFTLKRYLSYFGIKVYSTIQYPITRIKVTVRSDPCWKLLERGGLELNCIKYISKVIRDGQVILDVGSRVGLYTLFFSKLMQATGRVYAFDCDPKAFDILRDNTEKNSLTNVHIEKICMSNSIGQAKFRAHFEGGLSSLIEQKRRTAFKEVIVETTTIDKYCEENNICPDGIKIDVEGAEGLVIEGCRNIIEKYSPWVMLEFHGMFMAEKERRTNWHKTVSSAKKVIFIDGNSDQYHYGSEVKSLPDCPRFHVFIKY